MAATDFTDDIFICIFVKESFVFWLTEVKFIPTGPIDNNTALV